MGLIPSFTPSVFEATGNTVGGTISVLWVSVSAGVMDIQDEQGNTYGLTYAGIGSGLSAVPINIDLSNPDSGLPSEGCGIMQFNNSLQTPEDFLGPFRMISVEVQAGVGAATGWIVFGGSDVGMGMMAAGGGAGPGLQMEISSWKGVVPVAGIQTGTPQIGVSVTVGQIISIVPPGGGDDSSAPQSNDAGTEPSPEGGVPENTGG